MDEVFSMFFSTGGMASPFTDMDDFIKILEGDNDKRTRKMFRDLGKGYRPKGGRAGLAAKKKEKQAMKMMEKQMMGDLLGGGMGGGMEEMMMAMIMETVSGDIDDFDQFDKMMNGKSGKGKVPGMTKDEIKMMEMMEQMMGGKPKKKAKAKSDDEWQTDSDGEEKTGANQAADDDDGWETDSN